jgi:hypothetical protein
MQVLQVLVGSLAWQVSETSVQILLRYEVYAKRYQKNFGSV